MSNRLSMAKINSIETLHQSGHSNREIARILGVDRGAVNRYVRDLKPEKLKRGQTRKPGPRGNRTKSPSPFPNPTRGHQANATATASRSWQSSNLAYQSNEFIKTCKPTMALAAVTTAFAGSCCGSQKSHRCRFGGWKHFLARSFRSTLEPPRQ